MRGGLRPLSGEGERGIGCRTQLGLRPCEQTSTGVIMLYSLLDIKVQEEILLDKKWRAFLKKGFRITLQTCLLIVHTRN